MLYSWFKIREIFLVELFPIKNWYKTVMIKNVEWRIRFKSILPNNLETEGGKAAVTFGVKNDDFPHRAGRMFFHSVLRLRIGCKLVFANKATIFWFLNLSLLNLWKWWLLLHFGHFTVIIFCMRLRPFMWIVF